MSSAARVIQGAIEILVREQGLPRRFAERRMQQAMEKVGEAQFPRRKNSKPGKR